MRLKQWFLLLPISLAAGTTCAVYEDVSDPGVNVASRMFEESRAPHPMVQLQKEESRQALARQRAEKIRNFTPEQVQAWVSGNLSDADLETLKAAPPDARGYSNAATLAVPRGRLMRLGLIGLLVLGLTCILWYRRRERQMASRVSRKAQQADRHR